jgi:hypothetical protein
LTPPIHLLFHRHLIYATFPEEDITVSTDFSAAYDHKPAWTLTCEHPPRSNQVTAPLDTISNANTPRYN